MTVEEKSRVDYLRSIGLGYKKIAQKTGLSESTLKSYFLRRKETPVSGKCPVCGRKLEQQPHRKQKRFCSDACRLSWWKQHPELMNIPGTRTVECATCGTTFQSYRKTAKYCSRSCYYAASREKVPE